jgi:hypothetical protein
MVRNWKVAPVFCASCAGSGDWLSGWCVGERRFARLFQEQARLGQHSIGTLKRPIRISDGVDVESSVMSRSQSSTSQLFSYIEVVRVDGGTDQSEYKTPGEPTRDCLGSLGKHIPPYPS